ncbi:MAG: Nif3-like dinuclear metal center hexameric protein [Bdellovibrionales bacterium RIFOXYD12_FULL_39_22]|nr:MAG: Nif3-like dinuclear metal center hexameric protein [Bdellovibrionales bacterium RIFOXYB1_FULL_39_21]OFZ44287.1 MAG: Nif3-like dinuclear metal center hexameric protein [Bdellovibrionales bacterium RIFOXYC12_FULL_39_17]OFZ46835.1 MAG: Nif3-like dinuclear metal center hexameric protein [Bdellovibrionales bacterium RIFOXYC1_FULL_39_130]OFZ76089.1 MAG: Nif3-like dinuclear metal center hexameric protein [Bdellovibrionales bacterium RIFOXYD1_FULL_39_84]OFZ95509.1 MAG: Nif3-like dinuclear metal
MTRDQLELYLKELFALDALEDLCPNGLQIEGTNRIEKVAFAVSATADSIGQAIAWGADTLIVHHGIFWKFHGARPITGAFARRVRPLIQKEMNLFGIHLPLDGHILLGNARSIADKLEMKEIIPFGEYKKTPTGVKGILQKKLSAKKLQQQLEKILDHQILMATPNPEAMISSIGIITGGARSGWQEAAMQKLDAYITGEMSEHDWYESQEGGIHMFAGGHNATERFGIQNLMAKVNHEFKLNSIFIPSNNPA